MKNNKKKIRRYTAKTKGRMFVFFLIFGVCIVTLGYRLFLNLDSINNLNKEKLVLENKIIDLSDEKESLEADIARYVREKYLYSKKGELIIRVNE